MFGTLLASGIAPLSWRDCTDGCSVLFEWIKLDGRRYMDEWSHLLILRNSLDVLHSWDLHCGLPFNFPGKSLCAVATLPWLLT